MNLPRKIKSRIAPTPSGYLHLGNGLSFLMTWVKVRAAGGHLLLRIDDMDKARCRPEYVADIFETLDWLGIDYDEGPSGPDDLEKNWSQHSRLDMYFERLDELRQKDLLFACDCSRKQRREDNTADGRYSGRCLQKQLVFDSPDIAWRIRLPEQNIELKMNIEQEGEQAFSTAQLDRFFVRQKNEMPAYQLSSLVDDTYFGINYIVRGADLLSSSWSQQYLAHLFKIESFSKTTFSHHPLLLDDEGEKLSKSKGAGSLKAWRDRGEAPRKIVQLAARYLGVTDEIKNLEELLKAVSTEC